MTLSLPPYKPKTQRVLPYERVVTYLVFQYDYKYNQDTPPIQLILRAAGVDDVHEVDMSFVVALLARAPLSTHLTASLSLSLSLSLSPIHQHHHHEQHE